MAKANIVDPCRMFEHACAFADCARFCEIEPNSIEYRMRSHTVSGIVNSAFACEVFIKTLLVYHGIPHVKLKGHKLRILWDKFKKKILKVQHRSKERCRIYLPRRMNTCSVNCWTSYPMPLSNAKVLRINDAHNPLHVPFWLMNFDELAFFLVGAKASDDSRPEYRMLRELITNYKKQHNILKAGDINPDFITADSPIPFSSRKLWHEMNWWLNASFTTKPKDEQNKTTACVSTQGDPETLTRTEFVPYANGSASPYKSQHQEFYSYEKKY